MSVIVAYQGEPGAFSDDAATRLVPGAGTRGFGTFDEVAAAAASGEADFAALPVENSISGSIPRVYDLLWMHERLRIVDELVYEVVQNLIGTPTAALDEIDEVRSHPVALEQCRKFLGAHPGWKSVIVADTAGAVRAMMETGNPRSAAIASRLAAERYGATLLAESIADSRDNFTRFLLVARDGVARAAHGRACVALSLEHKPGALRDALAAFADAGMNLRTLVSRPSQDEAFAYRFYCEIEGVPNPDALAGALRRIRGDSRILGAY